MKVTMIMDYQLRLWGLCVFTQSWPLRPPSTLPTTRKHNVSSLLSCPDDRRTKLFFFEGVQQHLTFHETPLPTPKLHSDGEYFPMVDLDDPVLSEEPVPDCQAYLCIHLIPRPATTTQSSGETLRARTTSNPIPTTQSSGDYRWSNEEIILFLSNNHSSNLSFFICKLIHLYHNCIIVINISTIIFQFLVN